MTEQQERLVREIRAGQNPVCWHNSKAKVVYVPTGEVSEMVVTTRDGYCGPQTKGWLESELRIDGMPDRRASGHYIGIGKTGNGFHGRWVLLDPELEPVANILRERITELSNALQAANDALLAHYYLEVRSDS